MNLSGNNLNPSVFITGGSGFLGKALVDDLLNPGNPLQPKSFTVFDKAAYPGEIAGRFRFIQGDLLDYTLLREAMSGSDVVIHAAALVDWGTRPQQEVYDVNVTGTANVVRACLENNVRVLIYTSSLDVVYTGKSLRNIDEGQPYPGHHPNMYCRSKADAEKIVLAANNMATDSGPQNSDSPAQPLLTSVLRPSDIWGEADPFHIGSLVDMAKGGFYVRLGDGTSLCQHVYVRNMARAHSLVAAALLSGNLTPAGQAYFITDGPPSNFFRFFDRIVAGAGYRIRPSNLWLPCWLAWTLGATAEFFAWLLRPVYRFYPKLSRFAVNYTCNDFTFRTDKASREFGYTPLFGEEEALEKTIAYYRNERLGS